MRGLPKLPRSAGAPATPIAAVEDLPDPAGPPPSSLQRGEVFGFWQLARLAVAAPRLADVPRGDGGIVIDIPGFGAPEASLLPIRAFLRSLGWRARGWGFGVNRGRPEQDAERLAGEVEGISDRAQSPVSLVGWSLGGVIAREVAREHPDHVRSVVTYGTPAVGGPTHTAAATHWGPEECERIDSLGRELDAERPIRVPLTAIYSKRDGIVSWRACIDRRSPLVRHFEVGSTHLGLGLDPDVFEIVARSLAGR